MRPKNGVTVSTKDRHREHHAVTASTNPAVHILIHSDVYILKFSDGEQAVPPAAGWRDTTLPPTLTAARVTALLDSCDRTSLTGLRDFAVLTVLARLGLRAAEVAGLELGDVDWRTGEIVVPDSPGRDPIVTRILWLRGREPQNANAFVRDIYIHGTPEERNIGLPVSYGCIRMRSSDIVNLCGIVGRGAQVTIVDAPLAAVIPGLNSSAQMAGGNSASMVIR